MKVYCGQIQKQNKTKQNRVGIVSVTINLFLEVRKWRKNSNTVENKKAKMETENGDN